MKSKREIAASSAAMTEQCLHENDEIFLQKHPFEWWTAFKKCVIISLMEKVKLQKSHFFAKITKALDTLATRHIILRASGFGL